MSGAKEPTVKLAVGLGIAVAVLWVLNLVVVYCLPERGTFGDMFGAVNALFTGLAFAAVIYAILIQRHEVGLLKEELNRSKEIMEKQQELANVQIAAQAKQQFEVTFFNLLNLFNSLSGKIKTSMGEYDYLGKDAFPIFLEQMLDSQINKTNDGAGGFVSLPADHLPSAEDLYNHFYSSNSEKLGHYFRTLYNLFKFVDVSLMTDVEKRMYTKIIRAQLSNGEVMLLYLNGLSQFGKERFKPYLEKYAVLKNVDTTHELYLRANTRHDYDDAAFG